MSGSASGLLSYGREESGSTAHLHCTNQFIRYRTPWEMNNKFYLCPNLKYSLARKFFLKTFNFFWNLSTSLKQPSPVPNTKLSIDIGTTKNIEKERNIGMRRKLAMHAKNTKGETREWQENKPMHHQQCPLCFYPFVHSTKGGVTDYIKLAPCHSCREFLASSCGLPPVLVLRKTKAGL